MKRRAECCCGKIKIELKNDPKVLAICHCNNCKKRTGSAFGISAYFALKSVEKFPEDMSCYELSNDELNIQQKRYFCSNCGTTIYWFISNRPNLVGFAGGCFIETPLKEPKMSLRNSNKFSWLHLPDNWELKD